MAFKKVSTYDDLVPFDEDSFVAMVALLPTEVRYTLNFISEQLRKHLGACARRQPKVEISIPLIDPRLRDFFTDQTDSGVWFVVPDANENVHQFYSPYFQAGEGLTGFHRLRTSTDDEGHNIAAGPLVILPRGDMSVGLPPYLVTIKSTTDTDGNLLWFSFKLTCQSAVVSANGSARLRLANTAPDFSSKRWAFMPAYARLEDHAERHIQRLVIDHGLRRGAASVRAARAWTVEADPLPNTLCGNREVDKKAKAGHIWSEFKHAFVKFDNLRDKRHILDKNYDFRARRLRQACTARAEARKAKLLALKDEAFNAKRKAERRATRTRKKAKVTTTPLASDDDAASYSSRESLTPSEEAWRQAHNRGDGFF